MGSKVIVNAEQLEDLLGSVQNFGNNMRGVTQDINNYVSESRSHLEDQRQFISDKLQECRNNLQAAQENLNKVEQAEQEARNSKSGNILDWILEQLFGIKRECQREVDRWSNSVNKCSELLSEADTLLRENSDAIGEYREGERMMNSVLNDDIPNMESQLRVSIEKARNIENVRG